MGMTILVLVEGGKANVYCTDSDSYVLGVDCFLLFTSAKANVRSLFDSKICIGSSDLAFFKSLDFRGTALDSRSFYVPTCGLLLSHHVYIDAACESAVGCRLFFTVYM